MKFKHSLIMEKNTVLEEVIARDQCGQMTSNLVYKL